MDTDATRDRVVVADALVLALTVAAGEDDVVVGVVVADPVRDMLWVKSHSPYSIHRTSSSNSSCKDTVSD